MVTTDPSQSWTTASAAAAEYAYQSIDVNHLMNRAGWVESTVVVDAGASSRTVWALRRAFHAVEAAKEVRLKNVGITGAHYAVLINLGVAPGITGAEVARRLRVTPQNIASLVAKLDDRGWVERRPHERHNHVQELHLTEAGQRILDAADREVTALEHAIRARLGDDTATFLNLLEQIAALPTTHEASGVDTKLSRPPCWPSGARRNPTPP